MSLFYHTMVLATALLFAACKASDPKLSKTKYLTIGASGLTKVADNSSVTLCTNNMSRGPDIKNAAGMWFAALGKSPTIDVKDNGSCAAWVKFESLGDSPSMTTTGSIPDITMNAQSQWYNSFAVLVHEFGHAFGLADTYSDRAAGVCITGQPQQAVMCSPNLYKQPQQDDIVGVREVYKKATGKPVDSGLIPDFSKFGGGQTDTSGQVGNNTNTGSNTNSNTIFNGRDLFSDFNFGNLANLDLSTLFGLGTNTGTSTNTNTGSGNILSIFAQLFSQFITFAPSSGTSLSLSEGEQKSWCANNLRATVAQDKSTGSKHIVTQIKVDSGIQINATAACIGDISTTCGKPHQSWHPQVRSNQSTSSQYIALSIALETGDVNNLTSRALQANKNQAAIVTIDGLKQVGNAPTEIFRCQTVISTN